MVPEVITGIVAFILLFGMCLNFLRSTHAGNCRDHTKPSHRPLDRMRWYKEDGDDMDRFP